MKKGLVTTAVFVVMMLAVPTGAQENNEGGLLGDIPEGSRSAPVHLMTLYDEQGFPVFADPNGSAPFSTRQSCSVCHDYEKISGGLHFNATDSEAEPGRPGEPWIYWDCRSATQIPLSYRDWPGTWSPDELGLTDWQFTTIFGRQMPGGGPGEKGPEAPADPRDRWGLSGKLEINCLACHNTHPGQDQAEYARQIRKQNFKWAATASSELATVDGSVRQLPAFYEPADEPELELPSAYYDADRFDFDNQVLLDLLTDIPPRRCYFCHSTKPVGPGAEQMWQTDEDVHLKAGLTCVDCHRNDVGHDMVRGYPEEASLTADPARATLSCEGCHLGQEGGGEFVEGRLGAPVPEHPGIPPEHFDKLTCTACHSGPRPGEKAGFVKTSRAHALGTQTANAADESLPHIQWPVFVEGEDGKIAPHKLLWPSFWGVLKEGEVSPLLPEDVLEATGSILPYETDVPESASWPDLAPERVARALAALKETTPAGSEPVYITSGKLYRLTNEGLAGEEHEAGRPYSWAFAHNVRPAAQSLGVERCEECHATDAPFFFGQVAVDGPLPENRSRYKKMVEFERLRPAYTWAFAFSFVFRPWLKLVALLCCSAVAAVLALYGLRALHRVVKALGEAD